MKQRIILFDLGGVLFDLDYGKTSAAFIKLGLENFNDIYSQAKQEGIFDDLETGKIGPEKFREQVREWLPVKVSDEQIDSAWNAMLLGIPARNIEFLGNLRKHFKLYLLSNTNEIHLREVFRMNREAHGFDDLSLFMEKQYYSCRLQMRKPDRNIFEYVLKDLGLAPSELFFIDDSIRNIQGAEALGIPCHHLLPGENIQQLFSSGVQGFSSK